MRHNCIKNQQNFIFKEERIKIQTLKGGHTVPAEKIPD
jgi:predicted ABC-type ATPase